MLRYSPFSYSLYDVYRKSQLFRIKPGVWGLLLFVALWFAASQAEAGRDIGLYDVDVLVTDESKGVRQQAFNVGMDEVFIRISGDSIVMDKLKRPSSSRYVKQFSYQPLEKASSNEAGETLSHRLKIQYNGSLMEKYLLDNGFPVWGEHRSDVVIWLVVRDGKNEYVLKDTDQSLIRSATDDALTRRGIPQVWPLYDAKDRKKVSVVDLRGGFQDQVVNASKRYSRGPALTASLSWNGKQWQSSWSLLMATGNRHWSQADPDYHRLIDKAIDQAADAMGEVFAIRGAIDNQSLASIQINVQAVNSIEKYRYLENYLTALSAVEAAKTLKVDGNSATFELTLRSSEGDFLNLIKNDAELVKAQAIKIEKKVEAVDESMPTITDKIVATGDVKSDEIKPIPVYYYRLVN